MAKDSVAAGRVNRGENSSSALSPAPGVLVPEVLKKKTGADESRDDEEKDDKESQPEDCPLGVEVLFSVRNIGEG